MCIATSWTSHRVAVLVLLCDLIVLVLSAYVVQSSDLQTAALTLAASSVGVLAAAALATCKVQRGFFATALVCAFIMHGIFYVGMRHSTQAVDEQLGKICASQPQPPQDLSAVSSLVSVAAALGQDGSSLDPARVASKASAIIYDLTLQQQAVRARMGSRPGESEVAAAERTRKGQLQVCKLGYVQAVFGSLLQLITATTTLGGVAMLLEFVCFSKCWCEQTHTGQRFRRWMFDDVDDLVSVNGMAEEAGVAGTRIGGGASSAGEPKSRKSA